MSSSNYPFTILIGSRTAGVWTGVTTGTGAWQEITAGPQDLTITFTSVGTTSGGTLLVEETDDPGSAATASQVYSQAASGFTGGAKLAYHVRIGAGLWFRVRISSTITGGGTVYVTAVGS